MKTKEITVTLFRFDPKTDKEPSYKKYTVPHQHQMSAMNALDYIYQNLDPTIAYFDHAGCALGICARCTAKVNGKAGLLCQTEVTGDVTIEPISKDRVVRDLVVAKGHGRTT
jgi:succinate dehydrogenase/fumarate reductase-like Fe-S protein